MGVGGGAEWGDGWEPGRIGVVGMVRLGVGMEELGLVVRAAGSCNSVATLSVPLGGLILSAA